MILLPEYHANSIRLRRVLLLRSDIRLMPSDICFASFWANRISLKPQGFNITVAVRQYHSLRQQRISLLYQQKKREHFRYKTNLFSLSACNMGLSLVHLRLTSQMRCSHFAESVKFSAKDITLFVGAVFIYHFNNYIIKKKRFS